MKTKTLGVLSAAAMACAVMAHTAHAQQTYDFDVTGIYSYGGGFGDPLNEVHWVELAPNAHIVAMSYEVTLEAFDPSWLSEMRVDMTNSAMDGGVGLTPGVGVGSPGIQSFSSDGVIDLIAIDLHFHLGSDGLLRLEFWDTFNDNYPDPEGRWLDGTITIHYIPAPGALALLGMAGLVGVRRRR